MAEQRIFSITDTAGDVLALVQAPNKVRALAHYTGIVMRCAVATPAQLIAATKEGIEVEKAGEAE